MADTTYGVINQRTAAWATKEMLSHAEPILVLSKFGQNKPLPKNQADTVKFRRPNPFPVSTTPLVEGVQPTAQALTYTDVTVGINQYGGVTKITDVVADLAEDPVLKDASMLSGEQAAETVEMVTFGAIKAGTSVVFDTPAHTARNQVNTALSLGAVRAAVRALKSARGKPVNSMLDGSVKIGTKPIEGGYIAFGHTDLEADIRNLPGFIAVAEYGSRKPLCPEEVGSVENVRFILSPLLAPFLGAGASVTGTGLESVGGANVDVYPLIVVAKEAYGVVPLKGSKSIQPSVLNPGTPSKSDPLGQVGYVGWKCYFAATILNETWLQRVEVGATAI
jgi:N4-gp56 family major capsid protein